MNLLLPYATALLLGSMHALEADHMAAVTSFAVRRPRPLAAAGFGLRWAIGHGGSVILVGLLLVLLGFVIPEAASSWLDRSVGLVLIGLGAWTAWHAAHLHSHVHSNAGEEQVHLHAHVFADQHEHTHAATMVGALHGLAGAAPAVALLGVAGLESVAQGMALLVTFAVGTALGMAVYALVTGYVLGRAAVTSEHWARVLGKLTGFGTMGIGIYWLLR